VPLGCHAQQHLEQFHRRRRTVRQRLVAGEFGQGLWVAREAGLDRFHDLLACARSFETFWQGAEAAQVFERFSAPAARFPRARRP
jgi:hypothetical protein